MRPASLMVAAPCLASLGMPATVHADTFGGQVHVVRAKGALEGVSLDRTGDGHPSLPEAPVLASDAELAGADFRFDWMLEDLRVGGALMVFGVRGLQFAPAASGSAFTGWIDDGFGGSVEGFVGYEIMQGPVYLYGDARAVIQAFEAPVTIQNADGSEATSDYGRASLGVGPRLGMLVPIGHSLMLDLAIYQRVLGGLERTTAFVGLGYWENDRTDAFSQDLNRSYGGDF
ncbi:MAG: hypothetical protein ACOC1F_10935 [Myxococcota bacterium]